MNKFFKLYINENIKLFKKRSSHIFLILAVLSLFLAFGITNLNKNMTNMYIAQDKDNEILQDQISGLKEQLKKSTGTDKVNVTTQIEVYEYALKNDIKLNAQYTNYQTDLIYKLLEEKNILNNIDKVNMIKEYDKQKIVVDEIQNVLDKKDFNKYIELNKQKIQKNYDNKIINEFEYNLTMQNENTKLKYEINKYANIETSWKKSVADDIMSMDRSLKNKFNESKDEYLTEKDMQKLKDQKLINLYKLENNIAPDYSMGTTNYRAMYESTALSMSMMFIGLLLIMAAASSISEEISKGTIKFLIISPFKRYKILLAKLLTFTVALVVLTLILSQLNILVGNMLFKEKSSDYIYAANNTAQVMNAHEYVTVTHMLYMPEIFIYILLAIVLSTTIRNTSISNTLTIMLYIGSTIIMSLLNSLLNVDWLKYLPINNFNLVSKALPTYNFTTDNMLATVSANTTLEFSVIVLTITAILLLITMFESFNKRDIT
jgi:ABC-2 type transport system permease protein